MENYDALRSICDENNKISRKVIDEFLIYYAANRDNLKRKMQKEFNSYKHVASELKNEFVNMFKAQYLAHSIFKKDGSLKRLIKHAELQRLTNEEMNFLKKHAEYPWRFSFSVIVENPSKDFYIMEDIFSYEKYLLFSPGVSVTLSERPGLLWLNLIGYNGACWQSYGPIGAYNSFDPDDIFFFATELSPDNDDEESILTDIENNPLPYMLLFTGSNFPLTVTKEDQIVHIISEFNVEKLDTKALRESFTSEYNSGVYRFALKDWGEHPHFSTAFFDEKEKKLVLSAMTDRGFDALVNAFHDYGYTYPKEPFIRTHPSMIVTAAKIMNKEIKLNEYDNLFTIEPSAEDKEFTDKFNVFAGLVLPDINAGREPDIEKYAGKAGIDIDTARDLIRTIRDKTDEMRRRIY
ncbi:MAG: hypothetical protein HQ543_07590 [Bacteroidetes bacterium]|nr:hypothetical protein [Bacteroidota bacterium]